MENITDFLKYIIQCAALVVAERGTTPLQGIKTTPNESEATPWRVGCPAVRDQPEKCSRIFAATLVSTLVSQRSKNDGSFVAFCRSHLTSRGYRMQGLS